MPSPHDSINSRAIGWACLSQTIWLPLVAIEVHDQWKDHVRQNTPPPSLVARSPETDPGAASKQGPVSALLQDSRAGTTTDLVLGAASAGTDPILNDPLQRSIERSPGGSLAMPPPARRIPPSLLLRSPRSLPSMAATGFGTVPGDRSGGESLLQRSFTRAELLGGPITLNETEATMPALARAERARWASSDDPLAPLPEIWRTPMRRAIQQLPSTPAGAQEPRATPRIQTARVVHLPSSRVTRATDVPVALQSDGTVDILSKPEDPAVVEEIGSWSLRQQAPSRGSVAPAVVRIHPLPDAPPAPVASPIEPVSSVPHETQVPAPQAALPPPPPPLEVTTAAPAEEQP